MRKWILALFAATFVVFGSLGLAACVPSGLQDHTWSDEWSHNISMHWHECLDRGCSAQTDLAEHNWVLNPDRVDTDPDCGNPGLGVYICSDCGAIIGNMSIPATGAHKWELLSVDVEETCGADGVAMYWCTVCGGIKTEVIPATGEHDFSGEFVDNEEGHYRLCSVCGEQSELLPHVAGEPVESGFVGMNDGTLDTYCTDCGHLLNSENLVNPNAPVDFKVRFTYGGQSVEMTEDEDGNSYVQLVVGRQYAISFYSGIDGNGKSVSVSAVRTGRTEGVSLIEFNEYTEAETTLGMQDTSKISYLNEVGAFTISNYYVNPNPPSTYNEYTILFRYTTGGSASSANYRVRAEKKVYITAVTG